MCKHALHLPPHQAPANRAAQPIRQGKLDRVAYHGSLHSIPHLGPNSVPMAEMAERPPRLFVREVAVPLELRDARQPACPPRKPAHGIETDQNLRSNPGSHAAKPSCRAGSWGPGRRRLNPCVLNPRLQLGRHQVRQVRRVGKKREHQLHRKRDPLAGFEAFAHGFDGNPDPLTPATRTCRRGPRICIRPAAARRTAPHRLT